MNSIIITSAAPLTLNQEIALSSITKNERFFSVTDFKDAVRVMGKTLTPEDSARILALHCFYYDRMGAQTVKYLTELSLAVLDLPRPGDPAAG